MSYTRCFPKEIHKLKCDSWPCLSLLLTSALCRILAGFSPSDGPPNAWALQKLNFQCEGGLSYHSGWSHVETPSTQPWTQFWRNYRVQNLLDLGREQSSHLAHEGEKSHVIKYLNMCGKSNKVATHVSICAPTVTRDIDFSHSRAPPCKSKTEQLGCG